MADATIRVLQPSGDSIPVSVTSSASSTALPALASGSDTTVQFYNAGAADAFAKFGDATATAVVGTGFPIPKGQTIAYRRGLLDTYVSLVSSGSPTVYVTCGVGA